MRNKHKEWGSRVIPNPSWMAYGRWIFPRARQTAWLKEKVSEGSSYRPSLTIIGVYNVTFQ